MKAIIVGGGVGGLTAALMLHARGMDCEIYEQPTPSASSGSAQHAAARHQGACRPRPPGAPRRRRHPHLRAVLPQPLRPGDLARAARHDAGYEVPQFSIHRGRLQAAIYHAVGRGSRESASIPATARRYSQDDGGVSAYFFDRNGSHRASARGDVLIGRRRHQFARAENPLSQRGAGELERYHAVARGPRLPAFLTGRSMIVAGGMAATKCVVYPIAEGSRPTGG